MAKKLKVGDVIHGYRILSVFGPGMMAISYAAQSPSGRKVFFKQYKSPSPTVVWYRNFVAYQKELSERVSSGRAGTFAVRQVDAFEAVWGGPCYFQAYEFVDNGADLQEVLDHQRDKHRESGKAPAANPAVFLRHVNWAKVLVAGVAALHESRIIHADLKPANAYVVKDPTLSSGYQLKLIDMDFSVLADRRAPWHGFQGYVGSDNYRSPEHLRRGEAPVLASDVFTCALILYELLAAHHPYWSEDQAEYAARVQAYAARPPALSGTLPAPASNAEVSAILHRCLAPDPAERPTAAALLSALNGRDVAASARVGATAVPTTPASPAPPRPIPPTGRPPARAPAKPMGKPLTAEVLSLQAPDGRTLKVRVRTELGKPLMRQFGAEAAYWDEAQCSVERAASGQWTVKPLGKTANATLLNGRALTGPQGLSEGDSLAVGNAAKALIKLPLIVRAG
jgi:serine/threonine protein kinase